MKWIADWLAASYYTKYTENHPKNHNNYNNYYPFRVIIYVHISFI